ncbi:MAG: phosphonate ABC transporter ATP-binding protein [Rhodocyclaceae bacterium]|nr:phosphonate ABC transporter ATP-binding protein [Rhodocyclaceae bacterium]
MNSQPTPPAIEIRRLGKTFPSCKALDDVNLTVATGEMVALIGASGSGKSTLLRHIAGFVAADAGEIAVLDRVVQQDGSIAPDIRALRAQIGFVFQQFNLVNRLPVVTNVLVGLLYRVPVWRSLLMRFTVSERQRALEALAAVGIEKFAWQRAATLSGGQQQRAALARCLVQEAKVILADEPIASLDPESARNVMELLAQMNRERGCTVVVSLHQVEFAIKYCRRTVALHRGRVVYDGPSAALTPQLLGELYGADAEELFGMMLDSPALKIPADKGMAPLLAA